MTLQITTNHHKRDVIHGFELTESERKEFDYLSEEELGNATFFRYKGNVYNVGEVMVTANTELKDWDGYAGDTFFSGIVIKYARDDFGINTEYVIAGQYYSM